MPEPTTEGTTIYASPTGVHVLGYGSVGDWLAELGVASIEVVPVEHLPDESQDPSADLASVNEAYRLAHEEVERLRALLVEAEAVLTDAESRETCGCTRCTMARRLRAALEGGETDAG